MPLKVFKKIKNLFHNKKLPYLIFFIHKNNYNLSFLRKISIWILCSRKNTSICKKCLSCTNFKTNNNQDYYELTNKNINIEFLYEILETSPIQSKYKIIILNLEKDNTYFLKLIFKKIEKKNNIFIFFVSNINANSLIEYDCLIFNIDSSSSGISLIILKFLLSFFKDRKKNNFNFYNLDKILIINSFIYFFYKKKHLVKKNFFLKILISYKKLLNENYNLNIKILINFILNYYII